MLYNVNRDRDKDPSGTVWTDFFPEWKEQEEPQSEDKMFAAMLLWSKATAKLGA